MTATFMAMAVAVGLVTGCVTNPCLTYKPLECPESHPHVVVQEGAEFCQNKYGEPSLTGEFID